MSAQDPTWSQKIGGRIAATTLPLAIDKVLDLRIAHYDRSADVARPEYNEHVIYVFWHEYIALVLPRWGHVPMSVLVSQHRDGEWVNQVAHALGLNIVRGSTSRGGSSAIREMKRAGRFSSIAISPDGPRGPRRVMAAGPVYIASLLKMPIVPVGIGMDRPRRLDTWDRFAIPRAFSRCRMIFGPKIRLKKRMKKNQLDDARVQVERLLNDLSDRAEHWAVGGYRLAGEQPFVRARRTGKLVFPERSKEEPVPLKLVIDRAA